jgi:hypothetical protein
VQTTGDILMCSITGCHQPAYDITMSGRMACYDCWDHMLPSAEFVSLRKSIRTFVKRLFV